MFKYMARCKLMLTALFFHDFAHTKSHMDDVASENIAIEKFGDFG